MRSLQVCLVCELEMVNELLKDNWNHEKIQLEYGTFYNHDKDFTFHSGIVFTVFYSRTYKKAKNKIGAFRHIIAQGGRFDNTLAAYNPKIFKMNKKSIKTPFSEYFTDSGDTKVFAPSPDPSVARNQSLVSNSFTLSESLKQNTTPSPMKPSDYAEKSWRKQYREKNLKPQAPTQNQVEENTGKV